MLSSFGSLNLLGGPSLHHRPAPVEQSTRHYIGDHWEGKSPYLWQARVTHRQNPPRKKYVTMADLIAEAFQIRRQYTGSSVHFELEKIGDRMVLHGFATRPPKAFTLALDEQPETEDDDGTVVISHKGQLYDLAK